MGSLRSASTPGAATSSQTMTTRSAVVEREVDDAGDHGPSVLCPPPIEALAASDLRRNAPSVTTGSPGRTPSLTST
jgi:hypothetical protein